MIDDAELTRRSILGFGETVAAIGRWGVGAEAVIRRPDALGARIDVAGHNPWFNAAVVPAGAEPPKDDPRLPYCLWTLADEAPGRVESTEIAMPCLGLSLAGPGFAVVGDEPDVAEPSLEVVGAVNEAAYGESGTFGPLLGALRDDRFRSHGLRERGAFVCVALTLTLGDDVSIQYVATEAGHRRRGLAGTLLRSVMASAREEGRRSATLQASPDGLSVYERLGFRRVATLHGFVRPDLTTTSASLAA